MTPETKMILRVVGIVIVCVSIYFGSVQAKVLPLILLGCGLGFMFVP